MTPETSWWKVLRHILYFLFAAGGIGWLLGHSYLALALACAMVLGFWLHQLWRVQQWVSKPDSEPPEARGIWGDITDAIYHLQRRGREEREELESAVSFLTASLGAMKDAVIMVTDTGSIQWSNTSATRLLGLQYPRDEGQALLNLIRLPEFHHYFDAPEHPRPLTMPAPVDPDQVLQVTISEFGEGNRLVFARDVTAVSKLEKVRQDFVANVSHELRTPLTVISGYLATLSESVDGLDPRLEKPIAQMQQQSRRMESMLQDLLLLARIEHSQEFEEDEQVDVASLVGEVAEEFRQAHPERIITSTVDCQLKVSGRRKELHSAVANLVSNALKYSDENGPVAIRWEHFEGGGQLSVQDQGIGIDPIHHERLTERFYRVDKSRSTETGGTGLGLAIVKHVIAGMRAELRIDSAVGRGTTFTIVFPPGACL